MATLSNMATLSKIRVMSWRVCGLAQRGALLRRLITRLHPDIVCLQDIGRDPYPYDHRPPLTTARVLASLPMQHIVCSSGFPKSSHSDVSSPVISTENPSNADTKPNNTPNPQHRWRGVVTLSNIAVNRVWSPALSGDTQGRYLGVELDGGMVIHNTLVPSGYPPRGNRHHTTQKITTTTQPPQKSLYWQHKLSFLHDLLRMMGQQTHTITHDPECFFHGDAQKRKFLQKRLKIHGEQWDATNVIPPQGVMLCGGIGVAPHIEDIDPKDTQAHHYDHLIGATTEERAVLQRITTNHELTDIFRAFIPRPAPLFDSVQPPKRPHRHRHIMRDDHIWISDNLANSCSTADVISEIHTLSLSPMYAPLLLDIMPLSTHSPHKLED